MDDYHEFRCAPKTQIKERHLYWLSNYVSITRIFASTLGEITINPNNNVASGNGSANGSGTIKSGGINPSNNMWGFLHAFNLFVGFF